MAKVLCQQYTFNVSMDIKHSMRKLESEIIDLQRLVEVTGEQQSPDTLKCKKSLLTDLLGIKTQGVLVRSRSHKWMPHQVVGILERKNGLIGRFTHCIRTANGQELKESASIRKRAVQFAVLIYIVVNIKRMMICLPSFMMA